MVRPIGLGKCSDEEKVCKDNEEMESKREPHGLEDKRGMGFVKVQDL